MSKCSIKMEPNNQSNHIWFHYTGLWGDVALFGLSGQSIGNSTIHKVMGSTLGRNCGGQLPVPKSGSSAWAGKTQTWMLCKAIEGFLASFEFSSILLIQFRILPSKLCCKFSPSFCVGPSEKQMCSFKTNANIAKLVHYGTVGLFESIQAHPQW